MTADRHVTEPGTRYIDFLIPGLLGMNLLAGSMWGVGYVIVDMRVRKLLKRFAATPMKRSHFLWATLGGRMAFMIPEIIIILGAGVLLFGFPIRGNIFAIVFLSPDADFFFEAAAIQITFSRSFSLVDRA